MSIYQFVLRVPGAQVEALGALPAENCTLGTGGAHPLGVRTTPVRGLALALVLSLSVLLFGWATNRATHPLRAGQASKGLMVQHPSLGGEDVGWSPMPINRMAPVPANYVLFEQAENSVGISVAAPSGQRVGASVPIRPFLDGEYFDQQLIDTMSQALADACTTLGLKDKQNPAVRLLAMRIIEAAREGIHDRALLKAASMKDLGPAMKH